jgi:hypothetical protein
VYRDAAVARSFLEPLADPLADYGEPLRAWHALAAGR